MGRPILIKHRKLGFYNPAAKIIAEMLVRTLSITKSAGLARIDALHFLLSQMDSVVYAVQTLVFASIFYFLLGLNAHAKYFFTFWFIICE
jgi:hypothetical protein